MKSTEEKLLSVFASLTGEVHELHTAISASLEWSKSHHGLATRSDLEQMESRIMSKIADFLASQKAFNTRQAAAVDAVVTSITGVSEDVAGLKALIEKLQNSPGEFTPEDQATADELQAAADALTVKLETASTALQALDEGTPPAVPATP